jgi:magnesium-transporting ATPase (P-type)
MAFVKGAPDVLLKDCREWLRSDGTSRPLTEPDRQQILNAAECFAADALRMLGVAIYPLSSAPVRIDASLEQDLLLAGLVGMKDPIRPEATAAIAACRGAGIQASVFSLGLWRNRKLVWAAAISLCAQAGLCVLPWTRDVFHLAPLDPSHWLLIASLSAVPLPAMEVWKTIHRYKNRRRTNIR